MKCQYEGCGQPATCICCGRWHFSDEGHPKVGVYCAAHGAFVEDEGNPEYTVCCPNCDCNFGVN